MSDYVIPTPATTSIPVASGGRFPVRRVYCIGRNYAAHAIEMGHDPDREAPFFFQKNPNNLDTSGEFPYPPHTSDVHHEAELTVALKSGPAFAGYIREVLVPEIAPGTVVILDNLATHRNKEATQALRDHGCWFLYLPPYSPDLNPIEQAYSKLKAHLRRIGARTFTEVFDAIGSICNLYHPTECWNYFKAAGYVSG